MKKILSFLTLCLGLCIVSCYDDATLWERIEALESAKIATINEQVAAIKVSIAELEAVDKELHAAIAALEEEDENLGADIDSLRAKGAALDGRIDELKSYVEEELSATTDWVNATFSTLEQYQTTCDELAAVKVLIAELEVSFAQAISDAVAASETSIRNWVNEQLVGYWTIAETQAKLDTIKNGTSVEIAAIKADLNTAKEELTTAYKNEISKAISDSEGNLSKEIDDINSDLNKKMGAIEARLQTIEEIFNHLTREFAIVFDDTEIGVVAGGATVVDYTIIGATETTIVKAFGQNGWSAKVNAESYDKGTITVKAPNPVTEDEIIVLAYDGERRTIMSTINFVYGYVVPSQSVVEFGTDADTVSIELTSNLEYEVLIPTTAQDWLSVVEPEATRAATTETISFACKACVSGIRKAVVSFVDKAGVVVSTMAFVQQGSAIEVTLTEAGNLLETVGIDVFRDIKGLVVNGPLNGTDIRHIRQMGNLSYINMANARIVEGGEAYKTGNYTQKDVIGREMFYDAQVLTKDCEVILPADVTRIESFAFGWCSGVLTISFPKALEVIGHSAFAGVSLKDIIFPDGLKEIGIMAFYAATIGSDKLVIPESVEIIDDDAFADLRSVFKEVHLKALPKVVGENLFTEEIYNTTTLYIPKGAYNECCMTDFGRFKNIVEVKF